MGKAKKATKKFLAKGLEKELERRNKAKPLKRKIAQKKSRDEDKRKAKADRKAAAEAGDDIDSALKAKPLGDMNVDEFMANGLMDILNGSDSNDESDVDSDTPFDEAESDEQPRRPMAGAAIENDEDEDGSEDDDSEEEDGDEDVGTFDIGGAPEDGGDSDGDGASDGEDDDDEIIADNGKKVSEISAHKASLERMKKADPEFYQYLQENDADVLDFAEDDEDSSDEEEEEEDEAVEGEAVEGEEAAAPKSKVKGKEQVLLTKAKLAEWSAQLKANSLGAFKRVVRATYEACRPDDSEEQLHGKRRYKMVSSASFNALIKCSLRLVPPLLDHHLPIRTKPGKGAPLPSTSKAWKKLKVPIKVYLQSVGQLLSQLTDPEAERFVLHYIKPLCPYLACFPKLNRAHLKRMLHIWSHSAEDVRVAAFMVIRQTAIVTPHPFIETVLKGVYLTFIRNAKFPTPSMRPTLTFMLNAVVEIYRLDHHAAYQHAFVYIRQLAVHLRNAITVKKKGSFLQVYNWQFMFALRVWAKLLSVTVGDANGSAQSAVGTGEGLRPLLYPLVQVVLGAIKLIPTARYFPLRFHCLRTLIELMQKTGVYIPLSSYCLEVLESSEMKRRGRGGGGRALDLGSLLKVSKTQVSSDQFQTTVYQNVFELAVEFYSAIACTISFPEAVFLDTRRLRVFLKKNKSRQASDKFRPLLEKLEENARYITAQRANVGFAPKDSAEIKTWQDQLIAKGQNPFLRYVKVVRAAAKARAAMLAGVQDVEGDDYEKKKAGAKIGEKRAAGGGAAAAAEVGDSEDDEPQDEEEDEEEAPGPTSKRARTDDAEEDEDEDEDEGEEEDEGDVDPEQNTSAFVMSDFEFDSD